MNHGIVIKSTGSWFQVRDTGSGLVYACRIRGKMRLSDHKNTNPLAVGDRVLFTIEETEEGNTGIISEIEKRKNYLVRRSNKLSSLNQIIASNLDLIIPIVTLVHPKTSRGFLDRILVTAEAYSIPVLIVFNKRDLYTEQEYSLYENWSETYQKLGYSTLCLSALNPTEVAGLKSIIEGKTSLICGHSGTGKSTLLNSLDPGLQIKTAGISSQHLKGKHTTTFAEMHSLSPTTHVIDTPGIRDFGVVHIAKEEIGHYFPEIRKAMPGCKFNNCYHINEPECAVLEQVMQGIIDEERFMSYISIVEGRDVFR